MLTRKMTHGHIRAQVLEDGLELLLQGINISYVELLDYNEQRAIVQNEPWLEIFEEIRSDNIGINIR